MSDRPTPQYLDLLFSLQLRRIKDKLNPIPPHSVGPRKPSLEEAESKLLDLEVEKDE